MAVMPTSGSFSILVILVSVRDLCIGSVHSLEPIYWNTANKKFEQESGYILYPQIGDRLDLICPPSNPPGPHSTDDYEYYKLFLVETREEAENCEIIRTPSLLLTCDIPDRSIRFTIKFQEYSPNLWGHEFKTNLDYYIITTSDGTREGLDNRKGGACQTKGMKVVLKVGQNPSEQARPPQSNSEDPSEKKRGTSISDPKLDSDKENSAGDFSGNSTTSRPGENGPVPQSYIPIIAGAVGGAVFLLLVIVIVVIVCYRKRHSKHSDTHHPPLSLSTLTSPKRGSGNNNGSEPSDIIIPLRTADSAFCPHYEKVSGDYGHPVYIVQEMPPQSPANIYYKV
ncbi:ephrin-B3-like isoform X1 [Protopterus annectens]|uniref:ephrin-B3-like isoform X1 n=1 Tax=Protopterus annectens TaxID=7888 RepID=UPI001CF991DE|nr:ephrin-B3-like isoform X1 [Protopterus annectens]